MRSPCYLQIRIMDIPETMLLYQPSRLSNAAGPGVLRLDKVTGLEWRLSAMEVDFIIDFASSKSNISKDLEQALLRLKKSMIAATQDNEKPMETQRLSP